MRRPTVLIAALVGALLVNPLVASAAVDLSEVTAAATAPGPTLTAPDHTEMPSGQAAFFSSVPSGSWDTIAWEYSADGGQTWKTLPGKTGQQLQVKAVTARDGWQVRMRATSEGAAYHSAPAWLRVHSSATDPFPQSRTGESFALTSGWSAAALSGSTTSTGVLGRFRLTKVDRTARLSDLTVSYRDASGEWTPGSVRNDRVSGAVVEVTLSSKTSAATRSARAGDAWRIVDNVTGETEYFAATVDRPSMRQPALEIPRPALDAQLGGGLKILEGGYAASGDTMVFGLESRRLQEASIRWEAADRDDYVWRDTGRTGTSITLIARTEMDGDGVQAVVDYNGYVRRLGAGIQVRSTIADPHLLNHGIHFDVGWDTEDLGWTSWTVVPRTSSYDTSRATATLTGSLGRSIFGETSAADLRVYHRDESGTWTRAPITLPNGQGAPGGLFAFVATAKPAKGALQSAQGDLWRVHDVNSPSSVEYIRAD